MYPAKFAGVRRRPPIVYTKNITTMKHYFLFLIAWLSLSLSVAHAQRAFTGRVTDAAGKPLEFATAALYDSDSAFFKGSVTDATGTFQLDRVSPGRYTLEVRLIGFQTVRKPVDLRASEPDLGTITLTETGVGLSEVTVTAARPNITNRNGVLTTTVVGSVLANEHTLTDLLGKIPGIISDQGGISVFGGGSPIYYIDNRRVRSGTELSMLDVKNIRKVELLTNAGAKYGADVTAVIKIYTLHRATQRALQPRRARLDRLQNEAPQPLGLLWI